MTDPSAIQTPHQPLTEYYANEAERAGFVRNIFDATAVDYDRMESFLGMGSGPWYRGQALQRAGLATGMRVIDVGMGTGLVAREAIRIIGDARLLVGVDPSPGMMAQARLPDGAQCLEGYAESIPQPDASCDFLSMGYALRHLSDLNAAFREFHRVMKPGARLCLLEITCPKSWLARRLVGFYMRNIVPSFAFVIGRQKRGTFRLWRYYWDTIEACVPPEKVIECLRAAGFQDARRHVETTGPFSVLAEYQATRGN